MRVFSAGPRARDTFKGFMSRVVCVCRHVCIHIYIEREQVCICTYIYIYLYLYTHIYACTAPCQHASSTPPNPLPTLNHHIPGTGCWWILLFWAPVLCTVYLKFVESQF